MTLLFIYLKRLNDESSLRMIGMDPKQKIDLIFAAIFLLSGAIGWIYYTLVFYSLPFVLLCVIFFWGMGISFGILPYFTLFPQKWGIGYQLYESRLLRWVFYIDSIFFAYIGTVWFITEPPNTQPLTFVFLVFGLAYASFGIYIVFTFKKKKVNDK